MPFTAVVTAVEQVRAARHMLLVAKSRYIAQHDVVSSRDYEIASDSMHERIDELIRVAETYRVEIEEMMVSDFEAGRSTSTVAGAIAGHRR